MEFPRKIRLFQQIAQVTIPISAKISQPHTFKPDCGPLKLQVDP